MLTVIGLFAIGAVVGGVAAFAAVLYLDAHTGPRF